MSLGNVALLCETVSLKPSQMEDSEGKEEKPEPEGCSIVTDHDEFDSRADINSQKKDNRSTDAPAVHYCPAPTYLHHSGTGAGACSNAMSHPFVLVTCGASNVTFYSLGAHKSATVDHRISDQSLLKYLQISEYTPPHSHGLALEEQVLSLAFR